MSFLPQLYEHAIHYDLQAMDNLVENLSPTEREENRSTITRLYEQVYLSGMYDLDCNTITDRQEFIFFLLRLVGSIQRFFSGEMYHRERGRCYEHLAADAVAYEDKLQYIQQAIAIYNSAPPVPGRQLAMVKALIDKMEITQQFSTEAFTELLSFYRLVLPDATYAKALIHECFRVRALPFDQQLHWHQQLLQEFETAMHQQAAHNPLVYLDWAEAYQNIISNDVPVIDPDYKATLAAQTALLLKPLAGFHTESPDLLFRLGKAFADTAKSAANNELSISYYLTALDFFLQHNKTPQYIGTFSIDVTYTLLDLAQRYHEQDATEKLIGTFEHGLQIFSQVPDEGPDFTLNFYWGNFLIDYSRLVYNYQSPTLNRLAEEKLQAAKELIMEYQSHPYFARPYFSLARLAIKTGDQEKCVSLLLQCREAIRAKGFVGYDLSDALGDEDFREVWERLKL